MHEAVQHHNGTDSQNGLVNFINYASCCFMTEMGPREYCAFNSVHYENHKDVDDTMTLLYQDCFFFSFMKHKLNVGDICINKGATFDAFVFFRLLKVVLSESNCKWYRNNANSQPDGSKDSHKKDNGTELSYFDSVHYRFMKSKGADVVCYDHSIEDLINNDLEDTATEFLSERYQSFKFAVLIVNCILCIIGLASNLTSLYLFHRGVVKASTTYQLKKGWQQWIQYCLVCVGFHQSYRKQYHRFRLKNNLYTRLISPVVDVCFGPLFHVARTGSIWLTIFIGLYRYLSICQPCSNPHIHVTQHGPKYVLIIILLSLLYNIPRFLVHHLALSEENGHVTITRSPTYIGLSWWYYSMYIVYLSAVFVVCIPFLVLTIITLIILVELRQRNKLRKNMQNSPTSQSNVTAIFVTILIVFIFCQFPHLVFMIIFETEPVYRVVLYYSPNISHCCYIQFCHEWHHLFHFKQAVSRCTCVTLSLLLK